MFFRTRTAIASLCLVIVGLILFQGYLPQDDCGRHAAKAVSTHSWNEILLLAQPLPLDVQWGWERLLHFVYLLTGCSVTTLMIGSLTCLFTLFVVIPAGMLKRPEAWLLALALSLCLTNTADRLLLGRPFVFTMAMVAIVLLSAAYQAPSRKLTILLAGAIGSACLLHGLWHLWLLVIFAFLVARQWAWAQAITVSWVSGTIIASVCTLHPVEFLLLPLQLTVKVAQAYAPYNLKAMELLPIPPAAIFYPLILILLGFLRSKCKSAASWVDSPAFWLVVVGWGLGCYMGRFWSDWGFPAWLVLIALELERYLESHATRFSKLTVLVLAGILLLIAYTLPARGHWYAYKEPFPDLQHQMLGEWQPGTGHIIYSPETSLFYQSIRLFPNGDWRYAVGFEPALMPANDFATLMAILQNQGNPLTFDYWLKQMQPGDLLIIRDPKPAGTGLTWKHCDGYWLGRKP